jgi:diaminopimelate decarboxylase
LVIFSDPCIHNTRARVPEVLVKDDQYAVVRPRFEVDDPIAMERA